MRPQAQLAGIDQCNCFTVRRAARQISRFYDAQLQPTGLRITQFLTLALLSEVPNAAIMELADRLDIEQTAMGKMTTTLERDGLVTIHRSPTDRRSRLVALTAEGRALLEKAAPLWREAQRQFETLNGTERVGALRPGFVFPEAAERRTA